MMGFGKFLGGLGVAYEGMRAGEQDALNRDNAAADRSFQLQQRALMQQQQQRTVDEQARADSLRKANAAVPMAGTLIDGVTPAADGGSDAITDPTSVDAQNGSDVGAPQVPTPAPRAVTQDEELRGIAKNYHLAGDADTAFKLNSAADKIGMQRAAQQFQSLKASSAGKTALQIAQEASTIYNNDPLPGQITGVTDLGNGGARIAFRDRSTGQVASRDVKSPEEVLQALEGYYSPDTFAAYQKARYEAQLKTQSKIDEENAKIVTVAPGGTATRGGVPLYHNPKEFKPPANADGDPVKVAQTIALQAITKGDAKFAVPEIRTNIAAAIPQLMSTYQQETGRALPPEIAANVAVKAVTHPELVKPGIDINTGRFNAVITDDSSGETFTVRPGIGDATKLPPGMKPEDAKAMTNEMVAKLDKRSKGAGSAYVAAAFDKTGTARKALEQQTADQVQALARTLPGFSTYTPEQQRAVLDRMTSQAADVMQSRLSLVTAFGDAPSTSPSEPGLIDQLKKSPTIGKIGGLYGYLSDLGKDFESPDAKARLKARIAEAQSGGKPLSDVEKLRAQQADFAI